MNNKQKLTKLNELINQKVTFVLNEIKKKAKDKQKLQKLKKAKKMKMEGMTVEGAKTVEKDDVGKFWIVTNPAHSDDVSNVFESDIFNFSEKISNGSLKYENIKAIMRKEDRAKRIGERLVRERMAAVGEAKDKANELKNLKGEVINKAKALKKQKQETIQAVTQLKEALAKRKK